eukprot:Gregarina_sp_Pseudo_9__5370@NODE_64_length_4638_cov_86_865188_g59_i0_p6_GENE_NODE_64_length_4638_cov_86_865188_g59_i0NODE_64_length_4638_cov_86_865188_g59_i0_p6_ORF_typecomplete_len168_score13_08_NODE_64_length_4638_cov_86_865188_g59_i022612764
MIPQNANPEPINTSSSPPEDLLDGFASTNELRSRKIDRDISTTAAARERTIDDDKVVVGMNDNQEEDPEVIKDRLNQDFRLPLIFFMLSFIFPPLGWVGFMRARDSPRDTPRGAWAFRSCAMGSFLAFAYTLTAACLVGHFRQLSDSDATDWGCGFGGKCPLFKDDV